MTENQRRIEKAIAGYSCSLMNNTKWREVLNLVGKHNMPVQFSFIREETFYPLIKFPEGGTEGDSAKDCTAHGPFYLREIFAIRCPRFEDKQDPETGIKYNDDTRYMDFMKAISKLGQLPITENESGVTISGYQK